MFGSTKIRIRQEKPCNNIITNYYWSAAEIKPLLSRSKTLKASRISSSESVSFIFRAIMVRNSIWVRIAYHVTERFMSGRSHTREIDGAVVVSVNLIDHVLQLRLGRVLAQRAHNGTQLLGGDLACVVFVSVPVESGHVRSLQVAYHRHPCPVSRSQPRALSTQTMSGSHLRRGRKPP